MANNYSPSWRRALGLATMSTAANLGGSIGANIFLEQQAPRYALGFGFSLGTLLAGIVAAIVMRQVLMKRNSYRERMDVKLVKDTYSQEELWHLGDRSPLYRYVI